MGRKRTSGSRRSLIWVTVAIGAVVLGALLFVATALATDRAQFCPTCHEMAPYFESWKTGAHRDIACIECHVEPGLPARFAHKFVALGEVAAHVQGDTAFPRPEAPVVPNERCVRCHEKVAVEGSPKAFSHDAHVTYLPCQRCHPTAGHSVSDAALQQAGIFDAKAAARRRASEASAGAVAAVGAGVANVPGHVRTACVRCHDLQKTGCGACHKAPKNHPASRTKCAACHKAGRQFVFAHPATGRCVECHKTPASGHPSDPECVACHQAGKSWDFVHPARSDCEACHKPPTSHFGPDCARCHKPGTSFAAADFAHPPIPGEHSFRSFPCKKCHPQQLAVPSCTCHGGGIFQGD